MAFAEAQGAPLLELDQAHLAEFFGSLRERGLGPRSQARHVFSSRAFYRFALREGLVRRDPTENLRPPKAFSALPRYLTPGQVDALLAAPDVTVPVGLRDRAVLEVMYATGLRASELTGAHDRGRRHGARRRARHGKGRKERLVPLGREARRWVKRYVAEARAGFARGRSSPLLFLSLRGGRLSPTGLWGLVRRHAVTAGVERSSPPTSCATRSRATCSSGGPTCARCRPCWATPTSRRRRSTPTSPGSACASSTTSSTPGLRGLPGGARVGSGGSRGRSHTGRRTVPCASC